ncbi:hypothetical protein PAEAM_06710 [Paenibacillus sp. GM1FR]|uniref:DUF5704 domain-containing protein n=1 Tax=Paenibacillus sp. GM1FR TaxID=2059267 RepID=UPI000CADE7FA|nr:DUF5704 domain-containing protein [Paenibacillus sp. GM1FR]PJN64585.1 hypothetical protein PAEAM_06710 [Paenibacillus sp. GM1FR]
MGQKSSIKKVILFMLSLVLFVSSATHIDAGGGPGTKPELKTFHMEPSTPAKSQKKVIPVEGTKKTNIGVYIYQVDSLKWKVDGKCNNIELDNDSTKNLPVSSTICVDLDLNKDVYIPNEYFDKNGVKRNSLEIVDKSNEPHYMDNTAYYEPGQPILVSVESFTGRNTKFTTQIGGAIPPIETDQYNPPKWNADYQFNTDLYWKAFAEITKEINLTNGGQLQINDRKQLNATVKTKTGDGSFGAGTNVNSGNGTTTWTSSNPSVATVGSSGLVTAVAKGTTTITVLWEKDDFQLTTTTNVGVEEEPGGGGDDDTGGGGGSCTPNIGPPSQGTTMNMSDLDPNANGVIKADNRDAEKFDVLKGIPTSESLYTNAFADNYLFKQAWAKMSGKTTYDCNVTISYVREWTIPGPEVCPPRGACSPGPPVKTGDTVPKPYNFQITRDYSYWKINNLEVYKIAKATMENYALPGKKVTMTPAGYTPPTLESKNDEAVESHVRPAPTAAISYTPPKLTGGLNSPPDVPDDTGRLKGMAESNTPQSKVNNDLVNFNSTKVMDDAEATKDGPTPSNIPNPTTIGRDVLYKPNNMISKTLLNDLNTTSSGDIYYDLLPGNINGGANKVLPINGINTVTVHTPTVIYSNASDDKEHNQRTKPDASRRAFILDRPFTVSLPTSGQHRNILGYGNRDYAKYIKLKQVLFEFDVYTADKSTFYPANTWIDVPVSQIEKAFYLPLWVEEGNYTVSYRSFAENSPATGFTWEDKANLNLVNHVAVNTVPVQVIGRVYDFRVTDIADPNWETVFRTAKGSSTSKGTSYWVGIKGIDGGSNGSFSPYQLPIRRGSHPLANFKSVAVKTGYHFKFDLKTKGNMYGDKDAIRITPTFYFQDNNASTTAKRIPVDLYYHSDKQKFVKIGSSADVERRNITLNTRLRNVPYADIVNSAGSVYDLNTGWSVTRNQYLNSYLKRAKEATYVGGYDVQVLPSPLRTFINTFDRPNNANATPARVNASVQQWYGEYSLPAAVYVVPAGTDLATYGKKNRLDEKSPIFLKNGYITVNFNIETIRNADLNNPYLQYIHGPLNNQWWDMEGYDGTDGSRDHKITDPYGVQFLLEDGDVMYYDASKSSYDDYTPNGTH